MNLDCIWLNCWNTNHIQIWHSTWHFNSTNVRILLGIQHQICWLRSHLLFANVQTSKVTWPAQIFSEKETDFEKFSKTNGKLRDLLALFLLGPNLSLSWSNRFSICSGIKIIYGIPHLLLVYISAASNKGGILLKVDQRVDSLPSLSIAAVKVSSSSSW